MPMPLKFPKSRPGPPYTLSICSFPRVVVGQAHRAWDEMACFNSCSCLVLVFFCSEATASFCELRQLRQQP